MADEFHSLKLEVFKCSRETAALIPKNRHAIGVVRLNMDYTSLIVGFDPAWVNMYNPNGVVQYEAPLGKCRTRLTACLTEAQCAQVKRIYELEETPDDRPGWKPKCCYGCVWTILNNAHLTEPYQVEALYDRAEFPNVWPCRLLIMSRAYNQDHFVDDYAELGPDDLWDILMPRFVTCNEPRVRRLGDDFEFNPELDYHVGFWGEDGFEHEWDVGSSASDKYEAGKYMSNEEYE